MFSCYIEHRVVLRFNCWTHSSELIKIIGCALGSCWYDMWQRLAAIMLIGRLHLVGRRAKRLPPLKDIMKAVLI